MKIEDLFEGKGTKEQAGYIPRPKNGEKCINCTMWRDPNKCSAVAGDISPNGWCEWYAGGAYGKRGKRVNEAEGLGLTIFDIDETLMRTTAKIKVVKDGKVIRSLTNQEFNNYKLQPGEQFDFGEFRNAEKFRRESQPIGPMIGKLKAILRNAGDSKVIMLTARADFDDKETFLNTFRDLGIDMSRVHVHRAGNLPGNPAENKAVWIRKYLDTGKYSRVRLYDDSMGNIKMFNALAKEYPNVKFFPYLVTHEGSVKTVRETFDTEANWVLELNSRNIQWFSTKIADARIKLTYKRVFPDNVYIEFTRDGRLGVTGEGAQNKIFGAVINHIKQWVDKNKPNKIYFSALKGDGDTSRSSLYKRMVQRFANQNGYNYDVEDEPGEDTFILTKKDVRNESISEDGRIVKGVNTTVDVGPNEIKTQAAKFGNTVNKDGYPPTLSKKVKGKSTNVLFNLGLAESQEPRYTAKEWAIIEGGHSLEESKPKEAGDLYLQLENFADGKNPGRKGLSKRMGINTKASVSSLRKTAKNSSGEKQRMAHWLANMKAGKKK